MAKETKRAVKYCVENFFPKTIKYKKLKKL
jgi:hypothetical protein